MKRKHVGRPGPEPTVSQRWLAPIPIGDATILAALVLAETFELPESKRMGRPPIDAWDILVAGLVMGMSGHSARSIEGHVSGFSHRTLSRRLATDLLPMLERALHVSARLASTSASTDIVVLQTIAPPLPQLVARVGVGRARRRNEHGVLVDALLRSIGVNMKIYADHLGILAVEPARIVAPRRKRTVSRRRRCIRARALAHRRFCARLAS